MFGENVKYRYLFSGKTTIIAPTDSEEGTSEVSIKGKVNILGTQKCGAILYFKNLEITQGSMVSVFSFVKIKLFLKKLQNYYLLFLYILAQTYDHAVLRELEGNPVLFSYNNGKVSQNICSSEKDSAASINLKRAIISSLQISSIQKDQKEFFEVPTFFYNLSL